MRTQLPVISFVLTLPFASASALPALLTPRANVLEVTAEACTPITPTVTTKLNTYDYIHVSGSTKHNLDIQVFDNPSCTFNSAMATQLAIFDGPGTNQFVINKTILVGAYPRVKGGFKMVPYGP